MCRGDCFASIKLWQLSYLKLVTNFGDKISGRLIPRKGLRALNVPIVAQPKAKLVVEFVPVPN